MIHISLSAQPFLTPAMVGVSRIAIASLPLRLQLTCLKLVARRQWMGRRSESQNQIILVRRRANAVMQKDRRNKQHIENTNHHF